MPGVSAESLLRPPSSHSCIIFALICIITSHAATLYMDRFKDASRLQLDQPQSEETMIADDLKDNTRVAEGEFVGPVTSDLSEPSPGPDHGLNLLRNTLTSATQIACYPDHMTLTVSKDTLKLLGLVDGRQISLGDGRSVSRCYARTQTSNASHFVIPTFYEYCHTKMATNSLGATVYQNTLVLKVNASLSSVVSSEEDGSSVSSSKLATPTPITTYFQSFQCVLPSSKRSPSPRPASPFSFHISASHDYRFNSLWTKFPESVSVGRRIYVRLSLQPHAALPDQVLLPFPTSCYVSPQSNPNNRQQIQPLVLSGCPADRTTQISESLLDAEWRFSFVLERAYFGRRTLFLHCDLTPCYLSSSHALTHLAHSLANAQHHTHTPTTLPRLPQCVPSASCSGGLIVGQPPAPGLSNYSAHAFLGPLLISLKPYVDSDPEPTSCPPCSAIGPAQILASGDPAIAQHHSPQLNLGSAPYLGAGLGSVGISLPIVIGIAFASFFLGVLLVLGLCRIHKQTSLRSLRQAEPGNSSQDSGSSGSADSALLLGHTVSVIQAPSSGSSVRPSIPAPKPVNKGPLRHLWDKCSRRPTPTLEEPETRLHLLHTASARPLNSVRH